MSFSFLVVANTIKFIETTQKENPEKICFDVIYHFVKILNFYENRQDTYEDQLSRNQRTIIR